MTTSCAKTHPFGQLLQRSPRSANGHREAAGAAVATAMLIAAERVVKVVNEH